MRRLAIVVLISACASFVVGMDDRNGVRGTVVYRATLDRDDSMNGQAAWVLDVAKQFCGDAGVPNVVARRTTPAYGFMFERQADFVCGADAEDLERQAVAVAADPERKCARLQVRKLRAGLWVVDVCGELLDCSIKNDRWQCRVVELAPK